MLQLGGGGESAYLIIFHMVLIYNMHHKVNYFSNWAHFTIVRTGENKIEDILITRLGQTAA